tara:strand:+ start:304 stop:708 length:405 start_codon:yes stop_codon:yes gene_type:complete
MNLVKKILLIVLIIYIGIVVIFESWLGYSQPQGEGMVTINTTSEEGTTSGRVVSLLKSNDNFYIARNHWPKRWYDQALTNPEITVESAGTTTNYLAVPVTGDEYDQVDSDNPLPAFFRFLTGFPPRYFIRLDPK